MPSPIRCERRTRIAAAAVPVVSSGRVRPPHEFTRRHIATGEEVTMDYATEMTGDYELALCRCQTALCRGRVTGSDWQRPELRERYGDEFPPFLRRRMG